MIFGLPKFSPKEGQVYWHEGKAYVYDKRKAEDILEENTIKTRKFVDVGRVQDLDEILFLADTLTLLGTELRQLETHPLVVRCQILKWAIKKRTEVMRKMKEWILKHQTGCLDVVRDALIRTSRLSDEIDSLILKAEDQCGFPTVLDDDNEEGKEAISR